MRRLLAVLLALSVAGPVAAREFVAEAEDFQCLTNGSRAEGKLFYVFHKKKRGLKKALRKTTTGNLGRKGYPVGTILQLFPFEAMVKRGGKFNREGHGWEYFQLIPKADGTTEILSRGAAEVTGLTGSSCQNCHENLAKDHDAVCEFVVGPEGLGLTPAQILVLQRDGRCP